MANSDFIHDLCGQRKVENVFWRKVPSYLVDNFYGEVWRSNLGGCHDSQGNGEGGDAYEWRIANSKPFVVANGGRAMRGDGRFQSLFGDILTHCCGTLWLRIKPPKSVVFVRRIVVEKTKSGNVGLRK